ncbi:MAG TPA: hypothetical protein VE620_11245 [Myxococcales bacterium]|jgi:hypothetical protein|nr:hypothetical protein [Myxococcales bacterium]
MQQALAAVLVLAQAANKGSPFRLGEYKASWFLWLIVFLAVLGLFWAIATGTRRHGD